MACAILILCTGNLELGYRLSQRAKNWQALLAEGLRLLLCAEGMMSVAQVEELTKEDGLRKRRMKPTSRARKT